jgi:hypothetical protein
MVILWEEMPFRREEMVVSKQVMVNSKQENAAVHAGTPSPGMTWSATDKWE